jgi:WD40 repeat protein
MMIRPLCNGVSLALAMLGVLAPGTLIGGQAPVGEAKKAQQQSDLPPGALLRIGSGKAPMLHPGEIQALAFSSDGEWLASATKGDGVPVIRIWDVEAGKAIASLRGHKFFVRFLFFLPGGDAKNGPILVSGGSDNTIRFWNVKMEAELPHIINQPGTLSTMAVSPDGKKIASGSAGGKNIYLWDAATGNELLRWEAHPHGIASVAFGPDGKSLASSGSDEVKPGGGGKVIGGGSMSNLDNSIALWDTATGKALRYYNGNTTVATQVALSHQGKVIVALCPRVGALFWDADTGKKLRQLGGFGHDLLLTPDGKTAVTADANELRFNDVETGAVQSPLRHKHRFTTSNHLSVAFSPDGNTLATGGEEGRIVLWDVPRRTARGAKGPLATPVRMVAISGDSKVIATLSDDGVHLWNRTTGQLERKLDIENDLQWINLFQFLPNNRTLLVGGRDSKTVFSTWNWTNGKLERKQAAIENMLFVTSPTCSGDGTLFAHISQPKRDIVVYDINGKEVRRLAIPKEGKAVPDTTSGIMRLSPNGQYLLLRQIQGQTYVYDVEAGEVIYKKTSLPFAPHFSPDGLLIAGRNGKDITLLEAATGNQLAKYQTDPKAHGVVAFSPDGRMLAIGQTTQDGREASSVDLIEVATGKVLKSVTGHLDRIGPAAFTPDAKALVTGSDDCTVLVWDLSELLAAEKAVDVKANWQELANPDRRAAYAAVCRLRAAPKETITFLKTTLKANAPAADLEKVRIVWAIRLLEGFMTPEARDVLTTLAAGTDTGPAAVEARSALKRLLRVAGEKP